MSTLLFGGTRYYFDCWRLSFQQDGQTIGHIRIRLARWPEGALEFGEEDRIRLLEYMTGLPSRTGLILDFDRGPWGSLDFSEVDLAAFRETESVKAVWLDWKISYFCNIIREQGHVGAHYGHPMGTLDFGGLVVDFLDFRSAVSGGSIRGSDSRRVSTMRFDVLPSERSFFDLMPDALGPEANQQVWAKFEDGRIVSAAQARITAYDLGLFMGSNGPTYFHRVSIEARIDR